MSQRSPAKFVMVNFCKYVGFFQFYLVCLIKIWYKEYENMDVKMVFTYKNDLNNYKMCSGFITITCIVASFLRICLTLCPSHLWSRSDRKWYCVHYFVKRFYQISSFLYLLQQSLNLCKLHWEWFLISCVQTCNYNNWLNSTIQLLVKNGYLHNKNV